MAWGPGMSGGMSEGCPLSVDAGAEEPFGLCHVPRISSNIPMSTYDHLLQYSTRVSTADCQRDLLVKTGISNGTDHLKKSQLLSTTLTLAW